MRSLGSMLGPRRTCSTQTPIWHAWFNKIMQNKTFWTWGGTTFCLEYRIFGMFKAKPRVDYALRNNYHPLITYRFSGWIYTTILFSTRVLQHSGSIFLPGNLLIPSFEFGQNLFLFLHRSPGHGYQLFTGPCPIHVLQQLMFLISKACKMSHGAI